MGLPDKKFAPKFQVASRGFVAFPAFFIDELMPLGRHIPPSFWKYLLVLWRDINHHKDNTSKKTMRRFHIRAEDASMWTAALWVSGLFKIEYGWKAKHEDKGVPSRITYLDKGFEDWELFIKAFEEQVMADKQSGHKDSNYGFSAELLLRMIRIRYETTGETLNDEEKRILQLCEKKGFLSTRRDGQVRYFSTKRLPSKRTGVLSASQKVNGSYPTESEPDYDDNGKKIRSFREFIWRTDSVVLDLRMKGSRTNVGTAVVPT